ncbi:hypothetical protein JANAI62_06320 [Jannaschia pagri]|uniref:Uncharacterized protein n=1 Tax=Jannaschia pagri TaxID=2829797 RepID=A0ABQ4NHV3_9RHOB|nr:hypothetical protein JANAI61_03420 [Jannaschia sp. AI_61]GIT94009.1 hypothetical protein JANAI62_06320 [Jannaschia sp. AI_62]
MPLLKDPCGLLTLFKKGALRVLGRLSILLRPKAGGAPYYAISGLLTPGTPGLVWTTAWPDEAPTPQTSVAFQRTGRLATEAGTSCGPNPMHLHKRAAVSVRARGLSLRAPTGVAPTRNRPVSGAPPRPKAQPRGRRGSR